MALDNITINAMITTTSNKTTGDLVDEFVTDYVNDKQLEYFMGDEIHSYDMSYNNLLYFYQF